MMAGAIRLPENFTTVSTVEGTMQIAWVFIRWMHWGTTQIAWVPGGRV